MTKEKDNFLNSAYTIADRLKELGLWQKKWKFSCYVDRLFTYEYSTDDGTYNITIGCDPLASFLSKEKPYDMMNNERLDFVSLSCYIGKKWEAQLQWNITAALNSQENSN